ncbi:TonB-dependent receptor domain-containing protein [Thauera butanivorans]|uniref:TonB-dependent receptor domain-containing protein n=1 Tax=Thauera butanivorans TaxID=86174 RepID=UPI003AB6B033
MAPRMTALAAVLASGWMTASHAQTTLPEVEVRAFSAESREITAETLQRTQARDMAEVFATESSVSVGGGGRNAQRIYLRGMEGSNLNISIDGASQGRNLHQHRGGIGGIDPDLLKRVDIQAGPGADRGPGALGGSIRFETVDAQDLLDPQRRAGVRLKAGYASADEAWRGATTVYGLLGEGMGLLGHVSAQNAEDYRIGGGDDAPNTAGRDRDYFLKFSLLEQAGHSLRLSTERNTNRGLYLWGSTGSDMGYAPEGSVPVYQESERNTHVLNHSYRSADTPWIDWRFNLYRNEDSLKNVTTDTEMRGEKTGGELRNTFSFGLGPTRHWLTVGMDWFSEDLTGLDFRSVKQTTTSRNRALFIQDRIAFGPLLVSVGARHDDFDAEYGPRSVSGSEVSPNAGVELDLGRGVTAFAGYGEAVRGSGLIPASWMTNITESTNFNDGNPFEPERSRQREGGLRYAGGDLLRAGDQVNLELTLFRSYLYDTIERVGGGGGQVSAIRNNPDTLISTGWDLRAGWRLGAYGTRLAYSRVNSENQHGDPVAISRRRNAPTGDRLVWDNQWRVADGLTLGYTLTAVKRLSRVPAGQIERPGYALHDLQAAWQPAAVRGLSLALAIRNLGDKRYSSQTSIAAGTDNIVHEPGRDVRLSASYRF